MHRFDTDDTIPPPKVRTYRPSDGQPSGSFQERSFDRWGNVDRDEPISGEQVILAALADDAEVAVRLGILVEYDDVDLVALERGLVPVLSTQTANRRRAAASLRSPRGTFDV
jgi:hypothetical protein